MKTSVMILVLAFLLSIGTGLHAQIPRTLSYQGVLTDTLGNPRPDGTVSFTFSLYDTSTGGIAIWTETKNLQVRRGLFFTALGDVTPFGAGVRFDRPYWLGVKPGSDPELSPRIPLTSVGYSFSAIKSDTAHFALTAPQLSLPYSGSASSGGQVFDVTNSGGGAAVQGNNSGSGSYGFLGSSAVGVYGYANVSNGDGVVGEANSGNSAHGVTGKSSSNIGVYGLNTSSGNYGYLGGSDYGVYGFSNLLGGNGVVGEANNGNSAHGVTGVSSSNVGVYGLNTTTKTYGYLGGGAIGVYGFANLTGGEGVVGEANQGFSAHGVSGKSSTNVGVYGVNTSSGNYGFLGGPAVGVFGQSNNSIASHGVEGKSSSNIGVYGQNTSSGNYGYLGGPGIGVYGNSSSGYAGYFQGDVNVTGTLSKGNGSFKIDHPLDPEHKYLYHSFVESPDMMNIYNGNVVLDANGEAWVELPAYFEALNKDFRYQLTAIGAPGPNLHIAQEISGNRFKIAGGSPGMKVSWQVTGIRHDPFAEAHRIQVEVEKTGKERGKYIHPKEYGVSETLGIDYEENQKMKAEQEKMQAEQERMKAEQEKMNLERQKAPMLEQQRKNK